MRFLTKEEILELHADAIAKFGGEDGVRDENSLESAIIAPENRLYYEPESDLAALAATYAYNINKNHAFIDGNKRTAAAASEAFLNLNDAQLIATDDELINIHLKIAANELSKEDLENNLRKWIITPILTENEQLTLKFQEDLKVKLSELTSIQNVMLQALETCNCAFKETAPFIEQAKATKTGLALRAEATRIFDRLAKKIHNSISICEANIPTFEKIGREFLEILQDGKKSEHFRAEEPNKIQEKTDEIKALIILIEVVKLSLNIGSSILISIKHQLLDIETKEPLLSAFQHIARVIDKLDNTTKGLRETLDEMVIQFHQTVNSQISNLSS